MLTTRSNLWLCAGTIKAFPMILFGGMVEGVIKPMFAPLFKPPRELYSLLSQGAVQASHHSQGGLLPAAGGCGPWVADRCGQLFARHAACEAWRQRPPHCMPV